MKFIEKTPPTGKAVICIDNKHKKYLERLKTKIFLHTVSKLANYQVLNIRYKTDYSIFDLSFRDIKKK